MTTARHKDVPVRVLLVEDDVGLQKQLKWSLDGYDLVCARDRAEAMAAVRRHQPAVVLVELVNENSLVEAW